MSRAMTRAERATLRGLKDGDLGPLIGLLSSGRDRLHPDLQIEMAAMMRRYGDTEYCLSLAERPVDETRVTIKLRQLLDGKNGQKTKRAYPDTAKALGISERTVRRYYASKQRRLRAFFAAHSAKDRIWPIGQFGADLARLYVRANSHV
jgi:hypothetical protein